MLDYKMVELNNVMDQQKNTRNLDIKIGAYGGSAMNGLGRHWKAHKEMLKGEWIGVGDCVMSLRELGMWSWVFRFLELDKFEGSRE